MLQGKARLCHVPILEGQERLSEQSLLASVALYYSI